MVVTVIQILNKRSNVGAMRHTFTLYTLHLHCIVLYCIVLYCIVLYCIVLCIVYCIVLYCTLGKGYIYRFKKRNKNNIGVL